MKQEYIMSKNYTKHLIGTAGELAVAKIACLKGWVPSLTTNNCPAFDIFLFDPEFNKSIVVQVKTIRDKKNGDGKIEKKTSFPLGAIYHANLDNGLKEINCPYVFVHIDADDNFSFYVLGKNELIETIKEVDKPYRDQRYKKGKVFSPKENVAIPLKYIEKYKNQWDNVWK